MSTDTKEGIFLVAKESIRPKVKFDMHKYSDKLSEWSTFRKVRGYGIYDSPIPHGIASYKMERSKYVNLRQDTYWRSIAIRSDVESRMDYYFTERDCVEDELIDLAFDAVYQEFRDAVPVNIKPITFRKALKGCPQDTSPGYPLNRMGFQQKGQCYSILKRMNEMKLQFKRTSKVSTFPCLAGVRNGLCPVGENKPRVTWVYPLEVTLIEAMFAQPLFEKIKNSSILAWDISWLNGSLQDISRRMPRHNAHFGADFSKLDATIPESRIRNAFSLLEKLVDFQHRWQRNAWKFIVDYFVNTSLILYDKCYITKHGVPSGSYFTQVIDSIVNAVCWWDSVLIVGKLRGFVRSDVPTRFSDLFDYWNFMGDDSIMELLFQIHDPDRELMIDLALNRHALIVHPDKGFFFPADPLPDYFEEIPPIEFLGVTIWSAQDCGVSTEKMLAQASIPESLDKGPGDALVRILGLAYSHGTDYEQHQILKVEFERILSNFDVGKLTIGKGSTRDYFRYVLHMDETSIPVDFPSWKMIACRYRGYPDLRINATRCRA